MAKINLLTEQTYNRIAAGEVIDRPYSVVKELVENSIDAGATQIEIYVEQGGKSLIRVVDNGCGIERDDLKSAYLPHATSKISTAKDLENIQTLGFRGEAIASIAAISQMTIKSRVEGENCYRLSCNGGKMGIVEESAGEKGTEISVENLFFNTPVRLKFLKSDKAEEADITSFVSRFILDRPDIAFKYYLNRKLSLQSYGTNDEEALVCVYGSQIVSNCFKIDAEKHGIRIRGYIGNQNFFKPNKSYQSVFLNGRYVVNPTISAAVSNAYASYAMKRQYPFYVLYIEVPTEIVDVNVHPNKADVRFADNQIIYGCIYTVISAVLDGNSKALDYVISAKRMPQIQSTFAKQESIPPTNAIPYDSNDTKEKSIIPKKTEEGRQEKIPIATYSYEDAKKDLAFQKEDHAKKTALPFEDKQSDDKEWKIPAVLKEENYDCSTFTVHAPAEEPVRQTVETDAFSENKKFLQELEKAKSVKQNRIDPSAFVLKGNLFNTYLLYENRDEVYLIDQHAAHERLIYDRLKAQMQSRSIIRQPLLLPYVLDVNAFESVFLSDQLDVIRDIGFDIDPFGNNCFKVSAVPVDLMDIDLKEFFDDILNDISGLKSIKLDSLLKDKLAMKACKAAIKGGMTLTKEETDALFAMMDGDLGLKCPHGRPVVVKLTKYEIEKMFKRIV